MGHPVRQGTPPLPLSTPARAHLEGLEVERELTGFVTSPLCTTLSLADTAPARVGAPATGRPVHQDHQGGACVVLPFRASAPKQPSESPSPSQAPLELTPPSPLELFCGPSRACLLPSRRPFDPAVRLCPVVCRRPAAERRRVGQVCHQHQADCQVCRRPGRQGGADRRRRGHAGRVRSLTRLALASAGCGRRVRRNTDMCARFSPFLLLLPLCGPAVASTGQTTRSRSPCRPRLTRA
jgi:hypothetical protein